MSVAPNKSGNSTPVSVSTVMLAQSAASHTPPQNVAVQPSVAASPMPHVQVIQQTLQNRYVQHLYAPHQQQMFLPGNLTLPSTNQSIAGVPAGISLQLQGRAMDNKGQPALISATPMQSVQVIQQKLQNPYVQHLYAPHQQHMVLPGNLPLQPTIQSIAGELTGISLQLQGKAMDNKRKPTLISATPMESVENFGAQNLISAGTQVGPGSKTCVQGKMLAATSKSTAAIQGESGLIPATAANQTVVISQRGVRSNSQSVTPHQAKAITDGQKGKSYLISQPALHPKSPILPQPNVSCAGPVIATSQLKQLPSAPHIMTTQATTFIASQVADRDRQNGFSTTETALDQAYKYDRFTDITIQTTKRGVSMCFSAHRLVLAIRSPVFADIFYREVRNCSIIATDICPRAFDIILGYMYSDVLESDCIEELVDSFEAAQKFKINSFFEICENKLIELSSCINASNVWMVLKTAESMRSGKLREECLKVIQREPDNVLRSMDFLNLDKGTMCFVVKKINSEASSSTVLKSILSWMQRNQTSDKTLLSCVDFSRFTADEFLGIAGKFRNILNKNDIHKIASNLQRQGSRDMSFWCKFSLTKATSKLYEEMERVKENAMLVKTDCSRRFSKVSFYTLQEFDHEILLKIVVSNSGDRLAMMELAFGSDFIPWENLSVKLLCNFGNGKKLQPVEHHLMPCRRHYYVILRNVSMARTEKSFNMLLKLQASGLGMWCNPLSSQCLRVATATVSGAMDTVPTKSSKMLRTVEIKPFDDWLLFIDPKNGIRHFAVTSLFFESQENLGKYAKYL